MSALLRSTCLRPALLAASLALVAALGYAQQSVAVQVLDPTVGATVLKTSQPSYSARTLTINGAAWQELSMAGEGYIDVPGAPQLPHVCRSIEIPGDRDVAAKVVGSKFHDVAGVGVAPARGPIPRTQDPSQVPYAFGPAYAQDAWYPSELASVRTPYVMRDVRGVVVEINVLQYNPVKRVLRVWDEVTVAVTAGGPATLNALPPSAVDRRDRDFHNLRTQHFLNGVQSNVVPFHESGEMLIISNGAFLATLQPFVTWKNSRNIDTTLVDVASIGNNATAIKSYIQAFYAAHNLSYVLLVGDVAEVASGAYAGGLSDPFYSNMTGDMYPDILVGRFSASSVAQVQTQVQRSIEYEQMDHSLPAGGWNARATGIASNQGPGHYGEYDNQHMDLIRQDLLTYGLTQVDQIYDPSGSAAQVKSALEAGRRFVDYCGHGSQTSWGSTGWSNSDVNALANDNLLPIVHAVACVNGDFSIATCFGEAWLRATRNGEPTGAAGAYMSSINQYWNEPMYAQDETIDLICAEGWWGMGALWFAGSCRMMDLMGQAGTDMFMTWICFGDPSLCVIGEPGCPTPQSYCTAGVSTAGCSVTLSATGAASVGFATPFVITANNVEGTRAGVMYYGMGGGFAVPWAFGSTSFQCVKPPRERTGTQLAAGALGSCNGAFTLDWNAFHAAHPGALGTPFTAGDEVWVQAWYRDPPAPSNTNLSNGLKFTICP